MTLRSMLAQSMTLSAAMAERSMAMPQTTTRPPMPVKRRSSSCAGARSAASGLSNLVPRRLRAPNCVAPACSRKHEIEPIAAAQEFLARVDDEREPVAEATGVAGGEVPDRAGGHPYFLKADAGWPRISPSGAFTPISFIAFASGSGLIAFCGISGDSITLIECRNA